MRDAIPKVVHDRDDIVPSLRKQVADVAEVRLAGRRFNDVLDRYSEEREHEQEDDDQDDCS